MAGALRIASFNLESLDDGPRAPDFAARRAILVPQLRRLQADVLCLQEVDGQKHAAHASRTLRALDRLLDGTPYADYGRVCTETPAGGPRDRHNLVILSRFPIASHRQLCNDLVEAPRYRPATAEPRPAEAATVSWDRPVLVAALDLGGDVLHVLNLHLRAPRAAPVAGQRLEHGGWRTMAGWSEGYFIAAMKRAGQALEARLYLDSLFDAEPEPLVAVCGDFNATGHEVPLRIVMGDDEDSGNPALAPRRLIAPERGTGHDRRYSVIHRGRRQMLDHVLVSRRLFAAFSSLEIHNEDLGDEASGAFAVEAAPESFHAPLVARFDLS